ncbi:MAG: hypothetical protein LBR75_05870, partial [Prevotellaceae bacterium]|nr:hypothetical protein [Prevotellaceae bacterium]
MSLSMSGLSAWAQALVEQTGMGFNGTYDVRMVSAPVLQPAWVSSNNPLTVVELVTNEQMFAAGDELSLNNRYASASTKSAYVALKPAGASFAQQVYADCDDDMSTFQSSAAFLDFGAAMECTTIHAAYLYWQGSTGGSNKYAVPYPGLSTMKSYNGDGNVGNTTDNSRVKFKAPGMTAYEDVTSIRTVLNGDGSYMHMANVTDIVKGKRGGLFWVANVKTTCNSNEKAGWSLVVIFTPPNCPPRVIKFWDTNGGSQLANEGSSVTLNFKAGEVPAGGDA